MESNGNLSKRLVVIAMLVMFWVVLFLWLGRRFSMVDFWGVMLIGGALITFFGFLQMPEGVDSSGAFRESHIRLTVTATLIVCYIIYFGSVVYLEPTIKDGKAIDSFAKDLLPTLTNLLMVSISFYFGSTAAIEIADSLSKKDRAKSQD